LEHNAYQIDLGVSATCEWAFPLGKPVFAWFDRFEFASKILGRVMRIPNRIDEHRVILNCCDWFVGSIVESDSHVIAHLRPVME